jgi:branched-chain amino acid transport system ATP-binding protein
MTTSAPVALEARALGKSFSGFSAVRDVSFQVRENEVIAIIGPNGAGKSTLFDLLTGRLRADAGEVRLFGKPVTALPPWRRVKRGLGRSFQVSSVFPTFTAQENVQLGLMLSTGGGWNPWRSGSARFEAEAKMRLERVGLLAKCSVLAGDLSYGDQRTLELAVALSTNPRMLLLDEPTAGMGREESRECLQLIRQIAAREQIPLVFVEHDMDIVFSFATRIIVMVAGEVLMDDTPARVRADERVKEAYFGEEI